MTLEELRNEANKQGYKLVKNKEYVHILPCPICGAKRTHLSINFVRQNDERYIRVCSNCEMFKSDYAKTSKDTNKTWNNAVERYNNENSTR